MTEVPEDIAPLCWHIYSGASNQQTTNTDSGWLFPGYRAGHHISAPTLQDRFKVLGLDPQPTRNTALKSLVAQLDVRSLSKVLGYSAAIIAQHTEQSSNYWGGYAAGKAVARRHGADPRSRLL